MKAFANKQDTLRPFDLAVVLFLAVSKGCPLATFNQLGETLGLSASTVHDSLQRLRDAGLLRADSREPNLRALRNFVVHGVQYAFPPTLGREMRGVPTAHAGPSLRKLFDGVSPMVWPSVEGSARGTALAPLYPNAIRLPQSAPKLYDVLTLVDAVRVGQARERKAALAALDSALELNRSPAGADE